MVFETDLQSIKDRVNISRDFATAISECESLITRLQGVIDGENNPRRKAEWEDTQGEIEHALKHINGLQELTREQRTNTDSFTTQLGRVNRELDREKARI